MRPIAAWVVAAMLLGCSPAAEAPMQRSPTDPGVAVPHGKGGLVQRDDGWWRTFAHDSMRTGHLVAPAIDKPKVLWSTLLGSRIFAGAAIGSDGTIYVAAEGERFATTGHGFYALSPTGQVVWSMPLPAPVRTTPTLGAGLLAFGSYEGVFRAVTPGGTLLWEVQPEDLSHRISLSSPAMTRDGTIYFGDHGGRLRALSSRGEQIWSFTTGDTVRAAPSLGVDGTVYVGSYDGVLYAVTPDGRLAWSHQTGGRIDSAAAIAADGAIYVGSADGKLHALSADGSELWSVEVGRGRMVFGSPAIGPDGSIYVGTTGTTPIGTNMAQQSASFPFLAFDAQGRELWRFPLAQWVRSSPVVVADGTIYFGAWDGKLYALNPDGSLRWQIALGQVAMEQAVEASPAVGPDGAIYVGTWDGRFFAVGEDR